MTTDPAFFPPREPGDRELSTLTRPISPPRKRKRPGRYNESQIKGEPNDTKSDLAAVEAGEKTIQDHLAYFSDRFRRIIRPPAPETPRISLDQFQDLYQRNQNPNGHHFVIHQHDHPVAGVHYDLRLQFSQTSSISFALMYGLPGNPNSKRLNRNASETRVHNMWNHLVESASCNTGSLLIWDIGEYEVLPYTSPTTEIQTDDESTDDDTSHTYAKDDKNAETESEKLREGFQRRKIRLRLHGTRLPEDYTIILRLPAHEDRSEQPPKPVRRRKRKSRASGLLLKREETTSSTDEIESPAGPGSKSKETLSAMSREMAEAEDAEIRRTNAYPGATNSIGSIHQRKWFITLDRGNSGFIRGKDEHGRAEWTRRVVLNSNGDKRLLGFSPFYVRGREWEKSVITGRNADDVLADEGVEGYVGRQGWRAVLE